MGITHKFGISSVLSGAWLKGILMELGLVRKIDIDREMHRSRTKQETRLPKPVSLFYCSALIGIYIYALLPFLPFLWFGWF